MLPFKAAPGGLAYSDSTAPKPRLVSRHFCHRMRNPGCERSPFELAAGVDGTHKLNSQWFGGLADADAIASNKKNLAGAHNIVDGKTPARREQPCGSPGSTLETTREWPAPSRPSCGICSQNLQKRGQSPGCDLQMLLSLPVVEE